MASKYPDFEKNPKKILQILCSVTSIAINRGALNYIDRFLAANDDGPVVYETLSNMARVFHTPPH